MQHLGDSMKTTSKRSPNQGEQSTPKNSEVISENSASIYFRTREALRVSRTTILGMRYYPGQLAQEVWSHAVDEGEALEQQKLAEISTKSKAKQKTSTAKPETTEKDDKKSFTSKALARSLIAKRGITGSISLYAQSRRKFLEDAIEKGKSIRQERASTSKAIAGIDTSKNTSTDKDANDQQSSQSLSRFFDFRRGFVSTLSNRISIFSNELEACGKSRDLIRRQKASQKQQRRRETFETKLSLLGFTTHKELQDLNRRLTDVINITSKLATHGGSGFDTDIIQTLERRQSDRRVHTNTIDYEMRLYSRRGLDRRAA